MRDCYSHRARIKASSTRGVHQLPPACDARPDQLTGLKRSKKEKEEGKENGKTLLSCVCVVDSPLPKHVVSPSCGRCLILRCFLSFFLGIVFVMQGGCLTISLNCRQFHSKTLEYPKPAHINSFRGSRGLFCALGGGLPQLVQVHL